MQIANTHFPGIPVQDGLDACFCAVCTVDDRGYYAVYVGIGRGNSRDAGARTDVATWVAQRGTKLTYRQALQHFPNIPERQYRG